MTESISGWLEARTGATRRQMAIRIGQQPSTFNRNIETAEVIIAVCREYGLNPVEGLVEAGLIASDEVEDFAEAEGVIEELESSSSEEIIDLLQGALDELRHRVSHPGPSQPELLSMRFEDPDYSNMSEQDAKDYGLAAHKGDANIAHDELPHEP